MCFGSRFGRSNLKIAGACPHFVALIGDFLGVMARHGPDLVSISTIHPARDLYPHLHIGWCSSGRKSWQKISPEIGMPGLLLTRHCLAGTGCWEKPGRLLARHLGHAEDAARRGCHLAWSTASRAD